MNSNIAVVFKKKKGRTIKSIFRYGIWWVLVEFEDNTRAIVLEKYLEVI